MPFIILPRLDGPTGNYTCPGCLVFSPAAAWSATGLDHWIEFCRADGDEEQLGFLGSEPEKLRRCPACGVFEYPSPGDEVADCCWDGEYAEFWEP